MHIEPATPADEATFIALNRAVQDLHAAAHPDVFKPSVEVAFPRGYFAETLARPGVVVWLARDDGGTDGYLYAEHRQRPDSLFLRAAESLYIHHIAVRPEARGRGIGTALLRHARDVASERGIRRVELDVWSFNAGARRLFEAVGFRVYNEKLAATW